MCYNGYKSNFKNLDKEPSVNHKLKFIELTRKNWKTNNIFFFKKFKKVVLMYIFYLMP